MGYTNREAISLAQPTKAALSATMEKIDLPAQAMLTRFHEIVDGIIAQNHLDDPAPQELLDRIEQLKIDATALDARILPEP